MIVSLSRAAAFREKAPLSSKDRSYIGISETLFSRSLYFFSGLLLIQAVDIAFKLPSHYSALNMGPSPRPTSAMRPKIIIFGDSLTQQSFRSGGWGAALQNHYCRHADVILRGFSGYNSRWALYLLDKIFPKETAPNLPTLVTIFFGANDAALPDRSSRRQHVPVEEYKQNLLKMISHIQENSKETRIVLISPPPVDEAGRLVYAREMYGDKAVLIPERLNSVTKLYAEACIEAAQDSGVAYIDLWTEIQKQPKWQKKLLSDGLHFTPEGNHVVFDTILDLITRKSSESWRPSLVLEDMQVDFPWHMDVDSENPQFTFSDRL